uniref:Mannosyltransferase n=1 Tax=Caenorhabditis japonica TaxID=281687 RepID=A0A8R1EQ51_CAEJA
MGKVKRRNHATASRPPRIAEPQRFSTSQDKKKKGKIEKLYHKANEPDDDWQPTFGAVVKMLLSIRIASALWGVINDCDEVYNYWEPLHLFLYGDGFQTWEYSPLYSIRSYFYIFIHYVPASFYAYLFPDAKIAVFTLVRLTIGIFCLIGEYYAYLAICRKINVATGRFFIVFTICSSGMFVASTAFLPSSFAMACGFYCLGAYLNNSWAVSIFFTAAATLIGWPFAALLGFPIVVEMLLIKPLRFQFFGWAALWGTCILMTMMFYDSYYFGKTVFAPLQIVIYNVLGGPGPALYGTEPWTYYVKNLFLNWNIAFLLAFGAVPFSFILFRQHSPIPPGTRVWLGLPTDFVWIEKFAPVFLYYYSALLWGIIFFTAPHKEERFMFPIYPHIAFLAAVTCDSFNRFCRPKDAEGPETIYGILLIFAIFSGSRAFSTYNNYGAHVEIYKSLNDELSSHHNFDRFNDPIRVCVGKEWHRFPSSFFIPKHAVDSQQRERRVEFEYIQSGFRGILPKHYKKTKKVVDATKHVPTHMNDQNREEVTRYVPLESCDYLVDMDRPASDREPDFRTMPDKWKQITHMPFIDAANSHPLFRAFYVPFRSSHRLTFTTYSLYRKVVNPI